MKNNNYFPIPKEIFSLDLNHGEIAVYTYLMFCEDRKTFQCYPSYNTIGNALKMSKKTVMKYVKSLEDKCLISTKHTTVMLKSGKKQNGNLRYTIRPIKERLLIQAKYDGYFEILLLELTTGMRRGELLALQWNDLNFQTGELHICRQVYHVKGSMQITEPKTKGSIRTIMLSKLVLNVLAEYKNTVNSRWLFPSPIIEDRPRNPQTVGKRVTEILKKADCKHVRFHDLRHTFATTALANGMDVKTLSSIIGHVSSQTTLDIYLHSTLEMQRQAARKIDSGIAKNDGISTEDEQTPDQDTNEPCKPKFEAVQGKIRRAGTGCITKINDNLYEGRYSPRGADGKRFTRHIYAKTRDECEILLAEMIAKTKAEIEVAKAKLKAAQ